MDARQRGQFGLDGGKCLPQRGRQEVLDAPLAPVLRQGVLPQPQDPAFMRRPRAGGAQALPQAFDLHGQDCDKRVRRIRSV